MASSFGYRIGADENGLGSRLGPLVVTAVLTEVSEDGMRALGKRPPRRLRDDLGDSKVLVSHGNVALGEAWARVLTSLAGDEAHTPAAVFERLSLEGSARLREPCPEHVEAQCWKTEAEAFTAEREVVDRLRAHLAWWESRGVRIRAVRSSVVCTDRLNAARLAGSNRFVTDLHAMERLILDLRGNAGSDVLAVCGKVGGMGDYSRFFGPLSHRLHAILSQGKKESAYHFPGLGEVRFVRDADAKDPLVMLASLVGKWVRELLMGRISAFYTEGTELEPVSGYHDPVTERFVKATDLVRAARRIPIGCFERARDE